MSGCRSGFAACLALALLVLPGVGMGQVGPDQEALRNAVALSEFAMASGDRQRLDSAGEALRRLADSPSLAPWAQYFLGLSGLRMSLLARRDGLQIDGRWLEECIDSARLSVEQGAGGEGLALLGACYGYKSLAQPLGAALSLPRANNSFSKAQEQDPDNPRAWYLQALVKYDSPALLGGDREAAASLLERALALFEAHRAADTLAPSWGGAEAWLLSGRIHQERGDRRRAREALERALLLAPEHVEAQRLLREVTSGT